MKKSRANIGLIITALVISSMVSCSEHILNPNPEIPLEDIPVLADRRLSINGIDLDPMTTLEEPIGIPPGATKAHVRLTLAGAIMSTAYVQVNTSTGGAKGFNVNRDISTPFKYQYWRPGDDADLWITVDIINPRHTPGDQFKITFPGEGTAGPVACIFQIQEGAVNELPAEMPFHRDPLVFHADGVTPTVDLDMAAIEWSDSGFDADGNPVWRSRLSHGYSQAGNGETGLYTNVEAFPDDAVNPQTREVDSEGRPFVRLHTVKFEEPVVFSDRIFPFQASVLQGSKLDEWKYRRGVYRAQIQTPSRRGAWSAFWAVGSVLSTGVSQWPPEVDFFESFNGAYGAAYTPRSTSSAQHIGVHGSNVRDMVNGLKSELDRVPGFELDINLNAEPHDYTCIIEDDWITHFVDGKETLQHRNMLDRTDGGTDWAFYPIINVAVKIDAGNPYNEGTSDLLWYGLQYYAPGSGWYVQ
ncbi:glycoside hydrolase family 16 protein [Sphingobacterium pedocola]|uniref:GH16 domain-containing protein n=1 Tax=Sphingobacterium pedocola TaxID=2082722 RepID=A0ABR9TCV4_9SPHI|nr:family 16 glycosylhydrolase [Sphingobacterium pedocola]MBE8723197.1 hypothetical protein [Sphingobacterium pedocola]